MNIAKGTLAEPSSRSTFQNLEGKMVGSKLNELEKTGHVIVSGGSLKPHPDAHLFIKSKVRQRQVFITVTLDDFGTTHPHGHSRHEIKFEMLHFGTEVLWGQKIDYSALVDTTYEKSDDLISSLTDSVVWKYCKKIRFNITPNIVTCFMRMNENLNLRSINALEWKHDEVLRHFFEGRPGPLV